MGKAKAMHLLYFSHIRLTEKLDSPKSPVRNIFHPSVEPGFQNQETSLSNVEELLHQVNYSPQLILQVIFQSNVITPLAIKLVLQS